MKNELFVILVIVSLLTQGVRTFYEIGKHNGKIKASRLSFIMVFTNMVLLWVSWFALCTLGSNRICLPQGIRYAGLALLITGLILFLSGLFTIKALESYEGNLITHGIYSKIRHPMYLGFILWLVGMPLYGGEKISFALCIAYIANVLFWRYLEEKELIHRFPDYPAYRKTTFF
jgi:protein-S-isoprenylcysteine O-methyltransferase Ste14